MSFHVPDTGRNTDHPQLGTNPGDPYGAFDVASPEPGWRLTLICFDGRDVGDLSGWEHVSVHAFRGAQKRTPTWREMCWVKDLCWEADEVVMQLHPARADYVNIHPHVLHLWRPIDGTIPLPPKIMV
jgi:hypothetical protein